MRKLDSTSKVDWTAQIQLDVMLSKLDGLK